MYSFGCFLLQFKIQLEQGFSNWSSRTASRPMNTIWGLMNGLRSSLLKYTVLRLSLGRPGSLALVDLNQHLEDSKFKSSEWPVPWCICWQCCAGHICGEKAQSPFQNGSVMCSFTLVLSPVDVQKDTLKCFPCFNPLFRNGLGQGCIALVWLDIQYGLVMFLLKATCSKSSVQV